MRLRRNPTNAAARSATLITKPGNAFRAMHAVRAFQQTVGVAPSTHEVCSAD
jgi:hypothetical protein